MRKRLFAALIIILPILLLFSIHLRERFMRQSRYLTR